MRGTSESIFISMKPYRILRLTGFILSNKCTRGANIRVHPDAVRNEDTESAERAREREWMRARNKKKNERQRRTEKNRYPQLTLISTRKYLGTSTCRYLYVSIIVYIRVYVYICIYVYIFVRVFLLLPHSQEGQQLYALRLPCVCMHLKNVYWFVYICIYNYIHMYLKNYPFTCT